MKILSVFIISTTVVTGIFASLFFNSKIDTYAKKPATSPATLPLKNKPTPKPRPITPPCHNCKIIITY